MRFLTCAAVIVVMFSLTTSANGQPQFYGGVLQTPPEIGRDVNGAGGDTLIATLDDTLVLGGRVEARRRYVSAVLDLMISARRITVRNENDVDFPNHGESPALYAIEGRLYPLGESRATPYVGIGFGGALLSVDLDNVNDQEIRHLWMRSLSAGVKLRFGKSETFLDVQFKHNWLSGRGPIRPFDARVVTVGVGATLRED